ncbi:ERCC4 domain-containing protein [Natronococcus occultus]|uniref:ERCC4-type nuclease n=1 Tax=Natronococcus occultus SP4 TaxID=694430 RepID=L0K038_9EURY|nr:ERCC4 domain-containing protein [Natronococcus occultus]AGB37719.1 ERCC4-type nuclease [Natronococcus occultus SP4]
MHVAVTVDDREPAGVAETVRGHTDVTETTVERLPAGDLVVGPVGLERKTPRDYVNGVMSRSGPDLYDQLERLAECYDHAYVLLEGDVSAFDSLRTSVDPTAIRGSMASITARYGVPVIPCTDRRRLVDFAVRLGRKHTEAPSSRPLPVGSVPSRSEPTTKRMYGCIEGIGPELAATLYDAYPSMAELLEASVADLEAIEGIGERRARAVYEAIRAADR